MTAAAQERPRPVALITGASNGFGAAIAERLAQAGYDVAITATRITNLEATATRVEALGARVFKAEMTLADTDSVSAAVDAAFAAYGQLDVLVNNAAVTLHGAAAEFSLADWNLTMQSNVTGTFLASQRVGARWIAAGHAGSIVNIASTHGLVALAGRSAYGISKAALIHMAHALAIEWAPNGIRVNAIAPGAAETPTREKFLGDPAKKKAMLERIPLRRFVTAAEVAGAVAYLAGPDGRSITGQTLILDGGLTAG